MHYCSTSKSLGCHSKHESIAETWQIVIPSLAAQRLSEGIDAYRHPLHWTFNYRLHYAHALQCCLLSEVSEHRWGGAFTTKQLQGWHPGGVRSKACKQSSSQTQIDDSEADLAYCLAQGPQDVTVTKGACKQSQLKAPNWGITVGNNSCQQVTHVAPPALPHL